MKFILGVVVGIAGFWLYRARGQQNLSNVSDFAQQARETVTSAATAGSRRAGEFIDKAPLPPQVKDAASGVVGTGQAPTTPPGGSGARLSSEPETYGAESAAGRDRTKDGEISPDLGTP